MGTGDSGIANALIDDLGASAPRRTLEPGELLVEQGAEADEVYVVLSGRLDAISHAEHGDVVVGSIGEGQIVGEVTVIAGGRRTATLRAVDRCEVLVIDRPDFERWLTGAPAIADEVSAEARSRIDRNQVATMVADLVGDAEPLVVQEIVDRVTWRHLAAGELLFEEGDPSDAGYFVVAGRLLVTSRTPDGAINTLAELGRGEVVGELGLLDRSPRSATVRAVRDTTLASFSVDVFEGLVARSPGLMLHVARALISRMRRTPRRTFGRAASIAIATTASIDPAPILTGVVAANERFGSVRHLSST